MVFKIGVGSPVLTPVCVHQHRLAPYILHLKKFWTDLYTVSVVCFNDDSLEVSAPVQCYFTEIISIFIAMKGAIQVGSGIGHHFNFADLKLRAGLIKLPGSFAA